MPDATPLLHFRQLPEHHGLGVAMFAKIGELLMANGMKMIGGTATLTIPPELDYGARGTGGVISPVPTFGQHG